jgi:hypothetical protein
MVWQKFGGLYRKDIDVPAASGVNVTMTIPEEDRDHP